MGAIVFELLFFIREAAAGCPAMKMKTKLEIGCCTIGSAKKSRQISRSQILYSIHALVRTHGASNVALNRDGSDQNFK